MITSHTKIGPYRFATFPCEGRIAKCGVGVSFYKLKNVDLDIGRSVAASGHGEV